MKKVLILEDEVNIRSFVVINLRRAGYDAIEAGTGQEALDRLRFDHDRKQTIVTLVDNHDRLLPPEEPLDRKWREFLPPPADGAERCWQLPVLEMTLTPVCRTGAEQDQG